MYNYPEISSDFWFFFGGLIVFCSYVSVAENVNITKELRLFFEMICIILQIIPGVCGHFQWFGCFQFMCINVPFRAYAEVMFDGFLCFVVQKIVNSP